MKKVLIANRGENGLPHHPRLPQAWSSGRRDSSSN
jgi:hypothetical protein